MKRPLKVSLFVLFAVSSGAAQAQAIAVTSIDWSNMTYVTTGDLSVSWSRIDRGSQFQTPSWSDNVSMTWNQDGERHFSDVGQSIHASNTPSSQNLTMSSSVELGLHASVWKHVDVRLEGTGRVDFRVPYSLQLTSDGGYIVLSSIALYFDQPSQDRFNTFARLGPDGWPVGNPNQAGEFMISLVGNGSEAHYQVWSGINSQIHPVPEPSTYAFMGAGIGCLWLLRRGQKNHGLSKDSTIR